PCQHHLHGVYPLLISITTSLFPVPAGHFPTGRDRDPESSGNTSPVLTDVPLRNSTLCSNLIQWNSLKAQLNGNPPGIVRIFWDPFPSVLFGHIRPIRGDPFTRFIHEHTQSCRMGLPFSADNP